MGPEVRRRPRVAVTRAAGQADELARRLEAIGCEPVVWPLIAVEPLDGGPVDPSAVRLGRRDEPERRGRARAPAHGSLLGSLAAIGPGTAAALREHGYEPTSSPASRRRKGCSPRSRSRPAASSSLLPRERGACIVDALGADFLPLYRTVELAPERSAGRRRRPARLAVRGALARPYRRHAPCPSS